MTSLIRRFVATLAAAFAFALPASATNYSIDYTDIWYNSAESGWGIAITQQYETIFATLYVYGPDNSPRWYVASSLVPTAANTFSGSLYATTGTAFTAGWNPANSSLNTVGTMTLAFNSPVTGTLTYTVNGASVSKNISRFALRPNNLTGRYIGGMTAIASSCQSSADNGAALIFGQLNITQNGNTVAMRVDFTNFFGQAQTCNFTGTMQTLGKIGTISGGTTVCTIGTNTVASGSFTMTQIDGGINGISSVFTGQDNFCQYNGRFGGLKDN